MKALNYWLRQSVFVFCAVALSVSAQAAEKRIGIILFDGVLTSDVTAPLEVFGVASGASWFQDYEVISINVDNDQTVETEEGLTLGVDAYLADAPEVDVLLVPSAYDMTPLLNNPNLISYIQATAQHADWMASNCSGAFLLAEAGLLDGKRATTWAGGEGDLAKAYPAVNVQYDVNYVIDSNIITSNGSVVSYQAALALLAEIAGESRAKEVEETLQMGRVWKR